MDTIEATTVIAGRRASHLKLVYYPFLGQYLYVESSEPRRFGDRATLISGVLKGLQCMRFMYYMHGQDMGYLSVYRFGDGVMRSRLWRRRGDQGDRWQEARITLPCNSTSYMVSSAIAYNKVDHFPSQSNKKAVPRFKVITKSSEARF